MMRRMSWAGIFLVLSLTAAGCAPADAESGGQAMTSEGMVPDPAYQPNIGDRAVLYAIEDGNPLERLPLLKDVTAYDIYVRSRQARDSERLTELEKQGWLRWVAPGTCVVVLATQDRNHTGAQTASQVRIPDDSPRDRAYWTPSNHIARLILKEPE